MRALERGDNGQTDLLFTNGERRPADFVVFADGRRSMGRELLDPARRLRYAGYVAVRGLHPEAPEFLQEETVYNGGIYRLTPVQLPNLKTGVDWTLLLPATEAQFVQMFGASPTELTFVPSRGVSEKVRRAVDGVARRALISPFAAVVAGTADRMAVPQLFTDRPERLVHRVGDAVAVLIGDAGAPLSPLTGEGLNLGIFGADRVARALEEHLRERRELDDVFADWEDAVLPRVVAAQALAERAERESGLTRPAADAPQRWRLMRRVGATRDGWSALSVARCPPGRSGRRWRRRAWPAWRSRRGRTGRARTATRATSSPRSQPRRSRPCPPSRP